MQPSQKSNQDKTPVIGIIDSGVGGLSIFDALYAKLPNAYYAYAFDNKHFPYGTRSENQVRDLTVKLASALNKEVSLDLLVVACNTASTIALPALRETFSFPVVGVVPAIKPAAERSKTKCIGLLATPATVNRPYTDELISKYAVGVKVIKVGTSVLVHAAEAKLRGISTEEFRIPEIIQPFFTDPVDHVVLGCTHFPLLKEEFQFQAASRGAELTWVDSGEAIAQRVLELLPTLNLKGAPFAPHAAFATQQTTSDLRKLGGAFVRRGFDVPDVFSKANYAR